MPCHPVNGGFTAIICSRGRKSKACAFCGRPGGLLCDGAIVARVTKTVGGDVSIEKTCDRSICARCAWRPEPEKDYCPACAPEEKKRRDVAAAAVSDGQVR
jgi:hypothetical protein